MPATRLLPAALFAAAVVVSAVLAAGAVATAAPSAEPAEPTAATAATAEGGIPAAVGAFAYDDFEPSATCAVCHVDIARQHEQAMMAQSYVHHWDEIEYFRLALPHAEKVAKVAGVKAGCMGCHAPLAFLAGDIPPPRPAAGSRANEGVSCDVCHTMVGFSGDVPFNFNFVLAPGEVKVGPRDGRTSPAHGTRGIAFQRSAQMCGTCHNEQSPFGTWVKATHLEWRDGPYAEAGIRCQDCHMAPAAGRAALMGEELPDVAQHLFHGAHDTGKLAGAVEVRIHPDEVRAKRGGRVTLTAVLLNAKAGHKVPSGSAEERLLWVHVEAADSAGRTWHLPVDRKGFDGEDYTIASDTALAYQDLGDIAGVEDFPGLRRDGQVPAGDRIFRLPYLDPQGRMTVAQWNTASFGPDYRLAPLEGIAETYTWPLPEGVAPGAVTVTATVYYSRLVSSVGEYLELPPEEWEPVEVSRHRTTFEVL
jgi:nitrate/TMAO reductase-like tetraheme cytochrome c subunit